MQGKIVSVRQEHVRHQKYACDITRAVVHTALAPFSFATWITSESAHVEFKTEQSFTFHKKHGGIDHIDYEIKNQDYKRIAVDTIYAS